MVGLVVVLMLLLLQEEEGGEEMKELDGIGRDEIGDLRRRRFGDESDEKRRREDEEEEAAAAAAEAGAISPSFRSWSWFLRLKTAGSIRVLARVFPNVCNGLAA